MEQLSALFHIRENWRSRDVDVAIHSEDDVGVKGLELKVPFNVESLGPNDHEVEDGKGDVFYHAQERSRVLTVAALLEGAVRL